jgi:glycyl-tRNA synthetase beta chain
MQTNQKYFALTGADGKLRSRFLIVSNLETADPRHIIQGNERVVRPRLSDAKFFFEQDKKKKLADLVPKLANVVYHNKLGSQLERTERIKRLSSHIAKSLAAFNMPVNVLNVERAARLGKADLLTDMVGEFPELQGLMGRYYAQNDREQPEVAQAIEDHYRPRYAGDQLASSNVGLCVALADKLETLVGIFAIGLLPSGDKDPYALRRHALGIIRMLVEAKLPLNIRDLSNYALSLINDSTVSSETIAILENEWRKKTASSSGSNIFAYPSVVRTILAEDIQAILPFIYDRLRGYLRELGYASNEVEAVVSQNPETLDNILDRLIAVKTFATLPEAESLAAANKRITNILKKTENRFATVQLALLKERAEQALHAAMITTRPLVDNAFANGDFTETLKSLAKLRTPVDAFFNDVMVMAEDEQLRNNRIALLSELHGMLNRVADISKLAA